MVKKPVKYCVVNAFTESPFKGNPAAVCLLEEEEIRVDDDWLRAVVAEFNTSITCFLTPPPIPFNSTAPPPPRFGLRWFTPAMESKMCGHGTLASSHFLFKSGLVNGNIIEFATHSGVLVARRVMSDSNQLDSTTTSEDNFMIELDFPMIPLADYDFPQPPLLSKTLNGLPMIDMKKTTTDQDIVVVLPSGQDVADLKPQFDEIERCPGRALFVTGVASPGSRFDFITRVFGPKMGLKEDHVTGTAHCALASYWSEKLGKSEFVAYQASPRSGIMHVLLDKERKRVMLRGKAITIMNGHILV